jgi:hypothetical protein
MKINIENFTSMDARQLMDTSGGGFAFDVGRVLRFLSIALPGDAISVTYAITDWQINAMINDAENG